MNLCWMLSSALRQEEPDGSRTAETTSSQESITEMIVRASEAAAGLSESRHALKIVARSTYLHRFAVRTNVESTASPASINGPSVDTSYRSRWS
jgi:hypothetical protein